MVEVVNAFDPARFREQVAGILKPYSAQLTQDALDADFGQIAMGQLADERAELFINSLDTDLRITTNRPRTWGVRVSYDF